MKSVIIVGGGVAGAEAGTYLGQNSQSPLKIIEVECEPQRKFGGWGFQSFPLTETTNLAMRKMYLGDDPDDIFKWASECETDFEFHPDRPFPRSLMQEYVRWRRSKVQNPLVTYQTVTDEAMRVTMRIVGVDSMKAAYDVAVELKSGEVISANRLVMASGSISVKIPEYLKPVIDEAGVIVDPLSLEGHNLRSEIPTDASVLVLGTGLTGEEQVSVLLKSNHTDLTLFSRGGQRHFCYPKEQTNLPLVLEGPPDFLTAETPEEFDTQLTEFFGQYLCQGHSPEDIFAALRPFWEQVRASLGGCLKAADRLRMFKRSLAVNSIGVPWETSESLRQAEESGMVSVIQGAIHGVRKVEEQLEVEFDEETRMYDYIINAVGRNIIRHPIWDKLLEDGIAKKHAGIGVMVGKTGRMFDANEQESNHIWVAGMARAGDHTLRHGFLGNTAFNVPQVRSHIYTTMQDLLSTL